jgi:hypothetical protein
MKKVYMMAAGGEGEEREEREIKVQQTTNLLVNKKHTVGKLFSISIHSPVPPVRALSFIHLPIVFHVWRFISTQKETHSRMCASLYQIRRAMCRRHYVCVCAMPKRHHHRGERESGMKERREEKRVFEELLSIAHFVSLFIPWRTHYNGSVEACTKCFIIFISFIHFHACRSCNVCMHNLILSKHISCDGEIKGSVGEFCHDRT